MRARFHQVNTRQTTFNHRTEQEMKQIAKAALDLLRSVRKSKSSCATDRRRCERTGDANPQLGLWDIDSERSRRLQDARGYFTGEIWKIMSSIKASE
jgi:hypothetical protein